jgi:hypothetical protein
LLEWVFGTYDGDGMTMAELMTEMMVMMMMMMMRWK